MFSYLDGFDHICANVTPMEVVNLVNKMFLTFDELSEKHDVYKVSRKTKKNRESKPPGYDSYMSFETVLSDSITLYSWLVPSVETYINNKARQMICTSAT